MAATSPRSSRPRASRLRQRLLGYGIDSASRAEIVDQIITTISKSKQQRWLACINPHSFVVALDDKECATALKTSDWLIPDGVGIVLASKIFRGSIRRRLCGPDVFAALNERLNGTGGARVCFMGGSAETLLRIRERMEREHPNIVVAGTYSPPFKPRYSEQETTAMVVAVNSANADVLWVGLTAPKQEKWIHENRRRLNVKFIGAIGAVFDLYAGTVKDGSPRLRKWGLQWLSRLLREPRRLWRRTFISAPVFVWYVLKARLKTSSASADRALPRR